MDISKCFDNIRHDRLMEKVILPNRFKIGVLRCLKAGIDVSFGDEAKGTPQGGIISPTLANIALNDLDHNEYLESKGIRLIRLRRRHDSNHKTRNISTRCTTYDSKRTRKNGVKAK